MKKVFLILIVGFLTFFSISGSAYAFVPDHFYTLDRNGEGSERSGYVSEGIAFYAFPNNEEGLVPWIRLYGGGGNHFYTTNEFEANVAASGDYTREGVTAYVSPEMREELVPLFRLNGRGDHFYTTNEFEANVAASGDYTREGISAFVWPERVQGTVPVFRFFRSSEGSPPPTPEAPTSSAEKRFCCLCTTSDPVFGRETRRVGTVKAKNKTSAVLKCARETPCNPNLGDRLTAEEEPCLPF